MVEYDFKSENRSNKFSYKLSLVIHALMSVPKTLYFNFRCFPLKTAIRLPVLMSYKTRIIELHKGLISFNEKPYRFMIKFGFGGSDGILERKSVICLEGGEIHFEGKADFCEGISLRNAGNLRFGNRFWANKNCTIWCSHKMSFGNNTLLGWNIVFRDSDGHLIIDNDTPRPVEGEISIGNHCWICSECHILKNSSLGNDCVLGYGSLLTKNYSRNNALYVGRPAKCVKENISWFRGE